MIDGLSRPKDFIIVRDLRESLGQTSHFTNEETEATEAKGSAGSHIMPGLGAALGQRPDLLLPSAFSIVPCCPRHSLVLQPSLTVKTTPQTFPAFSDSLHHLI